MENVMQQITTYKRLVSLYKSIFEILYFLLPFKANIRIII